MSQASPIVSVIVPLYNSELTVERTLRSALAQTLTDFELIVVNNDSSDRGPEIASRLGDPRIRVVLEKKRGLSSARNAGIREAKGKYIAFLDADDLWDSRKLELQVALLERRPEIGMTFCHSELIDEQDQPIGHRLRGQTMNLTPELLLTRNPVGNGSTALIRRTHLALEHFDESLTCNEDLELWIRLMTRAQVRLLGIAQPLVRYRIRKDSLSSKLEVMDENFRHMLKLVSAYAPELIQRAGAIALANHQTTLARKSLLMGDTKSARKWLLSAFKLSPRYFARYPARSLLSCMAVLAGATCTSLLLRAQVRRQNSK